MVSHGLGQCSLLLCLPVAMIYSQRNFREKSEIIWIFVVINVPADDLAPLGARSSAGSVMAHIYIYIYDCRLKCQLLKNISLSHKNIIKLSNINT